VRVLHSSAQAVQPATRSRNTLHSDVGGYGVHTAGAVDAGAMTAVLFVAGATAAAGAGGTDPLTCADSGGAFR
jgi:hypothetical protein